MTDATAPQPTVEQNDSLHRYEIRVGGELAGFTQYVDRSDDSTGPQRVFFHTEIDEAFSGQGLASKLVTQALGDSIEHGERIVPVCPYVKTWLETHHQYDESIDKVTKDAMNAVREATKR